MRKEKRSLSWIKVCNRQLSQSVQFSNFDLYAFLSIVFSQSVYNLLIRNSFHKPRQHVFKQNPLLLLSPAVFCYKFSLVFKWKTILLEIFCLLLVDRKKKKVKKSNRTVITQWKKILNICGSLGNLMLSFDKHAYASVCEHMYVRIDTCFEAYGAGMHTNKKK